MRPAASRSARSRGSCRSECRAAPARTRTRRSTAALPRASRASADRNRARCRLRSAPSRCGRRRGRNRTAMPEIGSPSTVRCSSTQMPAARAHDQHRRLVGELIALLRLGIGEAELAGPAVLQVDLAFDVVRPGRRVGVLEIRHEDVGAGIERVDDHLAVDRPGDLHAAVSQIVRDRRDAPVLVVADHLGAGPEIRQFAGVIALLLLGARREQPLAPRLELAMQVGEEAQRRRREHLGVAGAERRLDLDAVNARRDRRRFRVARPRASRGRAPGRGLAWTWRGGPRRGAA